MRGLDFTSWGSLLTTLIGLALFTLIGVGVRLVAMMTIQQKRERANRQINERLRALIAAYKTLGGSFTGDLDIDPRHFRHLSTPDERDADGDPSTDRSRRIRDAAEAALSDIILLGTEDQVRLAAKAARDLAEGRQVETAELVVSLRDFIRQSLDLDPIPADITLPRQGPARPAPGGGKGDRGKEGGGGGMGMGLGRGQNTDDDDAAGGASR